MKTKKKILALILALCMAMMPVTAWGLDGGDPEWQEIDSWDALASALTNASQQVPTKIKLSGDVTCSDQSAGPLVVPANTTVTLDLNGKTINRNLTDKTVNGNVITVNGTLTVQDTSSDQTGEITGGENNNNGGGVIVNGGAFILESGTIRNNYSGKVSGFNDSEKYGGGVYVSGGSFTMDGGAIRNNMSSCSGGGVYVKSGSTFTMSGGAIQDNTTYWNSYYAQGGGVYVDGTFNVSGSPVISGNTIEYDTPSPQNVYLAGNKKINIETGKTLDSTAHIGVTTVADPTSESPVIITSGLNAHDNPPNGSADCFYSDKEYRITVSEDGNAVISSDPAPWKALQDMLAESQAESIILEADYLSEDPGWGPLEVPANVTNTLDLNGHIIDRGLTGEGKTYLDNGNVITVKGTLTLMDSGPTATHDSNPTLPDGGVITGGNNSRDGGGVYASGGTFNMEGGTIFGNQGNCGGGVYLDSEGKFLLSSGTISDNKALNNNGLGDGGGVYVGYHCSCTMSGGTISDNLCLDDGGGVFVNQSTFTMTGGTVTKNKAGHGGGVSVYSGTFNLNKGSDSIPVISQNQALYSGNGVCIRYSSSEEKGFFMTGGIITGNIPNVSMVIADNPEPDFGYVQGGGICVNDSNCRISGGQITENKASEGGGMYITESQVGITGGQISGNFSRNGGGVFSHAEITEAVPENTVLTMTGGEITGNKTLGAGGGVFFNYGTFTMAGGEISGNEAYGEDMYDSGPEYCGGGVYLDGSGEFIIGGEKFIPVIKNNKSDKGGGVYVGGAFSINGELGIYGNQSGTWNGSAFTRTLNDSRADNVYLPSQKLITVVPSVTANKTPIGVRMAKPGVFTTGANFADDAAARKVFQSDDERYEVWRTAQSQATLVEPGGDDPVEYKITVEPPQNGTVKASAKTAPKGETITVTTTPAEGFRTDTVTVKTSAGKTVATTTKDENTRTFTMPASDVTVSATFLPEKVLNKDQHIRFVEGYEDGTVRPRGNITRAETATMLYRLLTAERRDAVFTADNNFPDVKKDMWFNKAVSSMAKGGYIKGYEDGTFKGNRNITRAEFVTILVRMEGGHGTKNEFSDVSENHWAYEYILAATNAGWIEGYEDGTFRPDRYITRAEAMTILNRLLERGIDKDSELGTPVLFRDNADPNQWYYYEVIEASNDHTYTGQRPSENWTGNTVEYEYDIDKYERP